MLLRHLQFRQASRIHVFRISCNNTRKYSAESKDSRFRILFMGYDEFSCKVFQRLHAAPEVYKDILVVTQPDVRTGRNRQHVATSPLGRLASELGHTVHHIPESRKEFRKWMPPVPFQPSSVSESLKPNYILITASFGRILTDDMLGLFQPGRKINVHPSLLPRYRGPAPIQHTILNDDADTGVCVIEMTKKKEGIDAGALWGVRRVKLLQNSMFVDLRDDLASHGGSLLVEVLKSMLAGTATSQPQLVSDKPPLPAPMIKLSDTHLDFGALTSSQLVRKYRAISHQRPLTTTYRQTRTWRSIQLLGIEPAHVGSVERLRMNGFVGLGNLPGSFVLGRVSGEEFPPAPNGEVSRSARIEERLFVRTGDGGVVAVREVLPAGGSRPMGPREFWNGVWAPYEREKRKRVEEGVRMSEEEEDQRVMRRMVFGLGEAKP